MLGEGAAHFANVSTVGVILVRMLYFSLYISITSDMYAFRVLLKESI